MESRKLFSLCLLVLVMNSVQAESLEDRSTSPQFIQKRSYTTWPRRQNTLSIYDANKAYKSPTHTISRPFFIPVYGNQKRNIYYPPQPLYRNVGSPLDNPSKPLYQGPAYLPPSPAPAVGDRFGEGPIWGDGNMGSRPSSGGQKEVTSITPTRPPILVPEAPPLIHTSENKDAIQKPSKETVQKSPPASPSGPSNCVWAIVSCCSPSNPKLYSEECFEQRGCPGPFWGMQPCNETYAKMAIAAASAYFTGSRFSEDVNKFS